MGGRFAGSEAAPCRGGCCRAEDVAATVSSPFFKKLVYWFAPHGLVMRYEFWRHKIDSKRIYSAYRLPERELAEIFPGIERQVVGLTPGSFFRPPTMVLPLAELLTLMAICQHKSFSKAFEIGTFSGESTQAIALSTPPEARVSTLDIQTYEPGLAFAGRSEAGKIEVLIGDSRSFDFSAYAGQCDFVYIDGNHTYPFVKSDTEIALRLLKPGGVILWDDYVFDPAHPDCSGVKQALEELTLPHLYRIKGTRFAVHCSQ